MGNYNLMKNEVELNWCGDKNMSRRLTGITAGDSLAYADPLEPDEIGKFDTLEDAKLALNMKTSTLERMEGFHADYYVLTEYFIIEETLDADGCPTWMGDVINFAPLVKPLEYTTNAELFARIEDTRLEFEPEEFEELLERAGLTKEYEEDEAQKKDMCDIPDRDDYIRRAKSILG